MTQGKRLLTGVLVGLISFFLLVPAAPAQAATPLTKSKPVYKTVVTCTKYATNKKTKKKTCTKSKKTRVLSYTLVSTCAKSSTNKKTKKVTCLKWKTKKVLPGTKAAQTTTSAALPTTWGVTMNLFPFPNLFDDARFQDVAEQQIRALKNLGVKVVRFTYSMEVPDRSVFVARRLKEEGMQTVLVIEDYVNGPQENEYNHGRQFASDVIGHMGQYVDYYQLANEIGGSAIKGSQYTGTTLDHYDSTKLNKTLDFISGESYQIGQWAPHAKRIVTINSLNTAIIAEAIKRGVSFEILGWNWFSDFGTNLANKDGYKFMDVMKGFRKTLWVTELSRRGGASDANFNAQSDFLAQAIGLARSNGFTGIFPFLLVEDVVGADGAGYGLVQPSKTADGTWFVDWDRKAFTTYKDIIKKN